MEHQDRTGHQLELDELVDGQLVGEASPADAGELSRPADLEPPPAAGGGIVSPYVTAQPVRVSADVLAADDPAGALAARFLLRVGKNTRPVYAAALAEWFGFARQLGVEPLQAKIDHADLYALFLREHPVRDGRPLKPATVQRKLSTCSSFYRYAVETRVLSESPFLGVTRPKPPADSTTIGLNPVEMRRLHAAAVTDGPRSAALVQLLQANGLRISEALATDVVDLGWDRGHRTLQITRKGGRITREPLAPPTGRAIDETWPVAARGRSSSPPAVAGSTGSPPTGSSPASPAKPASPLPR